MPIVQIFLVEGRDQDAVSHCLKAVAKTIHDTLGAPLDTIRVVATGVHAAHWVIGDRSRAEIDGAPRSPGAGASS